MPRLAGDGTHYRLAVLNGAGEPTDVVFDVPSVTSILDAVLAKPALPNWYYSKALEGVEILLGKYGTKIPQDKDSLKSLLRSEKLTPIHARDTAGQRGRELHDGLEALARGLPFTPDQRLEPLLAWWQRTGLHPSRILGTEETLISFKHGFAGTLDLVYVDPATEAVTLADLKTGAGVYWSHFLQLAAYKLAWEEDSRNPPIQRSVVIHLNEKVGLALKEDPNVREADFLHVLEIYKAMTGKGLQRYRPKKKGGKK